jgi:hypothetical protein
LTLIFNKFSIVNLGLCALFSLNSESKMASSHVDAHEILLCPGCSAVKRNEDTLFNHVLECCPDFIPSLRTGVRERRASRRKLEASVSNANNLERDARNSLNDTNTRHDDTRHGHTRHGHGIDTDNDIRCSICDVAFVPGSFEDMRAVGCDATRTCFVHWNCLKCSRPDLIAELSKRDADVVYYCPLHVERFEHYPAVRAQRQRTSYVRWTCGFVLARFRCAARRRAFVSRFYSYGLRLCAFLTFS